MKLIYVAGPFRGATPWDVEQNVRRAEERALDVWKAGAAALCPHTNTRFFDKAAGCTGELFVEGTLEMLRRCDAMILCAGWEKSSGTKGEIREALRLGIPVFGGLVSLIRYVHNYPFQSMTAEEFTGKL